MTMVGILLLILLAIPAWAQTYDLVIRNGHVIDGTGSPWYAADVAIQQGRIAAIGHLEGAAAKRQIDARGMVVAGVERYAREHGVDVITPAVMQEVRGRMSGRFPLFRGR